MSHMLIKYQDGLQLQIDASSDVGQLLASENTDTDLRSRVLESLRQQVEQAQMKMVGKGPEKAVQVASLPSALEATSSNAVQSRTTLAEMVNPLPTSLPDLTASTAEEAAESTQSTAPTTEQEFLWTTATTNALLDILIEQKGRKGKFNKTKTAAALASRLGTSSKDHPDGEKCRLKIKSLREKYERQNKHNNTSGNDAIEIDERLVEAFSSDATIDPKPLNSDGSSSASGESSEDTPSKNASKRKKGTAKDPGSKRCAIDRAINFWSGQEEKKEESIQKRHDEKMNIMRDLVNALKH